MSISVTVPSQQLADDVGPIDGADIRVWDMASPAPLPAIDIVVPPYMTASKVLTRLAGTTVGLVQSQSIGFEGVADQLPPGMTFANAASVHETSTAELAVALALAAQRLIPQFVRAQEHSRWAPAVAASLADRRVLVLGFGGVGKAVAARLAPFEVELTAVASRARNEDGVQVHGVAELAALLPDTEILILTLPGGDATRNIIDEAALAALPDGALIVNVGRGPLIDTDALVGHVERGRIRVALDVTNPEPLPAEHPLWSLPGALIVPHVGGASSAMRPRIARLVREQIERMLRGEEPINVVVRT